jgi:hypothetical protein
VRALTYDSQNAGFLFAGTFEQGIYRSADGGASWLPVSGELAGTTVTALAATQGVILAGIEGEGLWMSLDRGSTWVPSLLDGFDILGAAADPGHPGTVYVISNGLEKSTDAGRHWKKLASQPQGSLDAVVVDGGTPGAVYVVSEIQHVGTRIIRSLDGGTKWSILGLSLPFPPSAFVVDPVTHVAYLGTDAGLVTSNDRGTTWRPARGWPAQFGVSALAAKGGTVYGGAVSSIGPSLGRGALVSTDGGSTWKPASQGLGNVRARVLAIAPHSSKTVAAGVDGWGVFKSSSAGASWALASRGLGEMAISRIAPDPFRPGTFYAGSFLAGVWKTTTAGASWQSLQSALTGSFVWALAPDPHRRRAVYGGDFGALARSLDGGVTWTVLDGGLRAAGFFGQLLIDPQRPSTLYAGTNHGLYRSGDGGATWTQGAGADCTRPETLAAGPTGTIYLAGHDVPSCTGSPAGGVLASSDGGLTWTFRGSVPGGEAGVMIVDPASDSTLYLGLFSLYRSTDGGATWQFTGLKHTTGIRALAFGGSDLRTLYAGANNDPARASQDDGATWPPAGDGFPPDATAFGLTWDPRAGVLYGATDQGLFSLRPDTP